MKALSSHRIIYLDTNHMSTLAGIRADPSAAAILDVLDSGRASLALSIAHFVEFSAPSFRSIDRIRDLITRAPIVLANIRERVIDQEVLAAYQVSLGLRPHAPVVLVGNIEDWHDRTAPAGTPLDFLSAMISKPELRQKTLDLAAWAADLSALKTKSYIVADPEGPIRLKIGDDLPTLIKSTPQTTVDDIFAGVGGLVGFPAYQVWNALTLERLRHPGFRTKPNDMMDEYHACYAPYAEVMALDRRTAFRFKQARLPAAHRVVHRLQEVLGVLNLS